MLLNEDGEPIVPWEKDLNVENTGKSKIGRVWINQQVRYVSIGEVPDDFTQSFKLTMLQVYQLLTKEITFDEVRSEKNTIKRKRKRIEDNDDDDKKADETKKAAETMKAAPKKKK